MPLKSLMIFLVLLAGSSNALSKLSKSSQFDTESNSLRIFKSTLFLQESTESTSSSDQAAEKALTESTTEASDTEGDKIEDGEEEEDDAIVTSASTLEETAPVSAFLQVTDEIAIESDSEDAAEKTDEDETVLDDVEVLVEGFNDDPDGEEQYSQNFIQTGLESFIELSGSDNTGSDDTSVKVEDDVEEELDEVSVEGLQTDEDKPEKTT
ncbi:hypothetical protein SteCoe_6275 [Stentor coeruleus]|uniref:RxLR effector protein n=1 Tax=Stentor coeruleus TaxID=5963 RepID=A0A1R2CQC9_9CILI|nr:hypothetical protein SteCoe_6275 [Stentor coeruleus]